MLSTHGSLETSSQVVERMALGAGHPQMPLLVRAHLNEYTHRRAGPFRLTHIGHHPPRHLHGDERIAVDVGVYPGRQRFLLLCSGVVHFGGRFGFGLLGFGRIGFSTASRQHGGKNEY
jgi:hypothetical protein